MNKEKNSLVPLEWLKIARKDWVRLQKMLENEDGEAAGYFLQQSLEKYLKAFLLTQGWKLRKIHELDALLDDAVKYNSDLEKYRNLCEQVSGYYFADRYPPLGILEITCEDVKGSLGEVDKFIKIMFPEEDLNA